MVDYEDINPLEDYDIIDYNKLLKQRNAYLKNTLSIDNIKEVIKKIKIENSLLQQQQESLVSEKADLIKYDFESKKYKISMFDNRKKIKAKLIE